MVLQRTEEITDDNGNKYLSSRAYSEKYGVACGSLPHACRADALIYQSHLVQDGRITTNRYFILDTRPEEHPKWEEYRAHLEDMKVKRGYTGYKTNLKKHAAIFLQRFDEARANLDVTRFRTKELCKMLGTTRDVVMRWVEIGADGFGKLPRIKFPANKRRVYDSKSHMYTTQAGTRVDEYFDTKDIRRFFKGELADPKQRYHTIDDAVTDTTIDEIAEGEGYFNYDPARAFPSTYKGFIEWTSQNIFFIDRKSRKLTEFVPNEKQHEFYMQAFSLNPDGSFKHKVICTSRPRGDYKSFDVTLLFLIRFFNMPEEQIFLVANSEKQTTHLLFNEAKKIIRRSPALSNTPGLDIQKQTIKLFTAKKEEFSSIEVMSVESGARSNATCFAFSEVWKLTDELNFAEIEQSIRGVENAWVLIESTVAAKGHIFQRLYEDYQKGDNPILYFQYYSDQHYNPKIDDVYLNHAKRLYPHLYRMFFRNRWEDAATGLFDEQRIFEMGYIGIDGRIGRSPEFVEAIKTFVFEKRTIKMFAGVNDPAARDEVVRAKAIVEGLSRRLMRVDDLYSLPAMPEDIDRIKNLFDCEFVVGLGIDRAKQMSKRADRTAVITVAKGITGVDELSEPIVMYFILDVYMPESPTLKNLTERIMSNSEAYGIDFNIRIEEYQGQDLDSWCKESGFNSELAKASFKHQEEIFAVLSNAAENGMIKCPIVPVWRDENDNIYYEKPPENVYDLLREELSVIEYEAPMQGRKTGYIGSPFKKATNRTNKGEIKDDTAYALAHATFAASIGETITSGTKMPFSSADFNNETVGTWQ